jgi:hypothetical protein
MKKGFISCDKLHIYYFTFIKDSLHNNMFVKVIAENEEDAKKIISENYENWDRCIDFDKEDRMQYIEDKLFLASLTYEKL